MDDPTSYLGLGLVIGIPGAFIACLASLITGNVGFAHGGCVLLVGSCSLGALFGDIAFFPADASATVQLAGAAIVDTVAIPNRDQLRIVTRDAPAWTWQLSLRAWSGLPVARLLTAP